MRNTPIIGWFDKSTVRHLRLPFSLFLLPVFLFALSQAPAVDWRSAILAFIILHLLIFPSSNGYNSYQDRDKTSIGGLRHPPAVSQKLYYATLLFDAAGISLGFLISPWFALFVLVFVIMSRLYSFRGVRLKKYPVAGFLTVFIFQGAFVYLMTSYAISPFSAGKFFTGPNTMRMAVASLFIGSMYPLTQIYQHKADSEDGVMSISCLLGYKGTFIFSAILFTTALLLYSILLINQDQLLILLMFLVFTFPVIIYLSKWFGMVRKSFLNADFDRTMKANLIASTCMNLFFLLLILNNHIFLL